MDKGRTALLWSLPFAATIGLAAIGAAQLVRPAPVRRIEGVVPPPADPGFREAVQAVLGFPLQAGSKIELLQNGDGLFPVVWADMKGAERSIAVHSFFWSKGEISAKLVRVLTARARAGIRVRVLYDGVGAIGHPRSAFNELRDAGAEVLHFRPPRPRSWHAIHRRSHARYVLVDDRIAYTGGFGFADEWAGSGNRAGQWRDTAVRVEGPLAHLLGSGFRSLWAEASGSLVTGLPGPDRPAPRVAREAGGAEAVAFHSSPTSVASLAERLFALSIAGSRERLYVSTAYFVPNPFFRGLLSEAAGRGVDVRLLTASRRSDIPLAWWAGRSFYGELMGSGVRIYEYQPGMMHAKTLVADGRWSVVGAANLDNRSLTHLDESLVGVLDQGFGQEMESVFRADLELSREIRLDEWRRRPVRARVAESLASSVARVL